MPPHDWSDPWLLTRAEREQLMGWSMLGVLWRSDGWPPAVTRLAVELRRRDRRIVAAAFMRSDQDLVVAAVYDLSGERRPRLPRASSRTASDLEYCARGLTRLCGFRCDVLLVARPLPHIWPRPPHSQVPERLRMASAPGHALRIALNPAHPLVASLAGDLG